MVFLLVWKQLIQKHQTNVYHEPKETITTRRGLRFIVSRLVLCDSYTATMSNPRGSTKMPLAGQSARAKEFSADTIFRVSHSRTKRPSSRSSRPAVSNAAEQVVKSLKSIAPA